MLLTTFMIQYPMTPGRRGVSLSCPVRTIFEGESIAFGTVPSTPNSPAR